MDANRTPLSTTYFYTNSNGNLIAAIGYSHLLAYTDIPADILAAHGYGDPDAYRITVTHTDAGTDAADTASNRTHVPRRFIGQ